jgi:hypothetical protein
LKKNLLCRKISTMGEQLFFLFKFINRHLNIVD